MPLRKKNCHSRKNKLGIRLRKRRQFKIQQLEGREYFAADLGADFNGDGIDDLVTSNPNAVSSNGVETEVVGQISVRLGSQGKGVVDSAIEFTQYEELRGSWNQRLTRGNGNGYGTSVAYGDFNGDGYDDLAIGIPGQDLHNAIDAGSVEVIFGSEDIETNPAQARRIGLSEEPNAYRRWYGESVAESGDHFGSSLTVGDFNGDGFDDLAVGAPGEDIAGDIDAGAISVYYGWSNGFLGREWLAHFSSFRKTIEPVADAQFGSSLAAADFSGDGIDDLAVGSPGAFGQGVVGIFSGSTERLDSRSYFAFGETG